MTEPTTETPEKIVATAAEIKAACVGADSDFILGQLEIEASVGDAQAAFIEHQSARIGELENRIADLEQENAKLSKPKQKPTVTTPVALKMTPTDKPGESELDPDGDIVADWEARISADVKAGKTKTEAIRNLVANEPEMHEEYVAEVTRRANDKRK